MYFQCLGLGAVQGVCHISFHSVKYRLMSSLLKYSLLPGKQGKETLGGRGGGGGGGGGGAGLSS